MTRTARRILIFILVISMTGCSSMSVRMKEKLYGEARKHNAGIETINASPFLIQSITMFKKKGDVLRIYIEGDGRAWVGKKISSDPSPHKFTLLSLMFADPFPDKAYLARPCQYVRNSICQSRWWTYKRYGKEVLSALNQAVSHLKKAGNWKKIELTGYSGGATIALLLAAQRNDIISVRTIAGNLAPDFANDLHGISPEPDALQPLAFKSEIEKVPQIHFAGLKDNVIPVNVIRYYLRHMENSQCVRYQIIPNATHSKGWLEIWPTLLEEKPQCR